MEVFLTILSVFFVKIGQAFRNGVDVAIGTPGRLIDHIERGNMRLNDLRFICMDEADQMVILL
jgi:superfamily II DNA/RNA helicase